MRHFLLFAPFLAANLFAQQQLASRADAVTENVPPATDQASEHAHETKRIFWIVPNFRTAPTLAQYQPLDTKEKFHIATEDSFDRGTVALAGIFGGLGMLTNSNPSFGHGAAGYARYLGTSYGDFFVGNYMTEAVFPTILHQDPRFFRRGTGSGRSRLGYAMSQIFVTHGDNGHRQPNYSEVLGNSAAAAIGTAWYADNRTGADVAGKLATQLGVDMASNILKEFWPDMQRKLQRHHASTAK